MFNGLITVWKGSTLLTSNVFLTSCMFQLMFVAHEVILTSLATRDYQATLEI